MKDAPKISADDFAEWDWETVYYAGSLVLSEIQDIAFHCISPGEAWDPFVERGDVTALILEARRHIDRLDAAIRKARADIAGVERNARLAAGRRVRAERKAEEQN